MRSSERGFTFIEVLVVMGIIAVLAGLTVVALRIAMKRGPEFQTSARVQRVAAVVTQWKNRFDQFPPSDPKVLARVAGGNALSPMPNTVNVGIETLYQALYWPTFGTDPSLGDDDLSNTDDDQLDKDPGHGKLLYEIKDNWGNPLVYFLNTDYAQADQNPPTYRLADNTDVAPRPWKYKDASRGFAEPRGFQLFSMGEDQIPNTEDDIKSWGE